MKDLNIIVCSRTGLGALRAEGKMKGVCSRELRRICAGLRKRSDFHITQSDFVVSGEESDRVLFWIETGLYTTVRQYPEVLGMMQQIMKARLGITCTIDCSGL